MRTSTLKLSILALLLCFGFLANAQQNSYYNYNYPWTFGINGGAAWQYSDVNGGLGYGFGIDLAKRVAGKEGSWFAIDGRGRLLFARQYGQSYQRTYDLSAFSALNGVDNSLIDYTTANGGIGHVFHNHQTTMGEFDIEGVLTLNRLRERTGWTVQGFAGIGIGVYNTMIDQTDGAGNLYDYTAIDSTQSKSRIRGDVRRLRDRVYETEASGFANGIDATLMPSLGLSVGYQVTPRFSLGLEHKATWTLSDNMDGVIDLSSNRPEDVHHYTSLYMRWTLGEDRGKEPIIDVTAPNRNPYTVKVATGTVRANIKHVTRRSGVTVNLNGQRIDYFDYNTQTGDFFVTAPLVEGQNTITIYAQNDFGSDEESVVFVYEYQNNGGNNGNNGNGGNTGNNGNNGNNNGGGNNGNTQNPPQVDITNPRNNPYNTTNQTINIGATIRNVSDRNDVRYTVNGYRNTDFRYSNGQLTSTVTLQEGNNVVEISATNSRGEVRDSRTIVYKKPQVLAPKVTFLSPNRNPYTVSEDDYSIKARIDNVTNNKDIRLTVNGKSEPFSFKNGQLGSLIDLKEGTNIVEISAYNEGGTDDESTTIVYKKEQPKLNAPKVTITSPTRNPHNTDKASAKVTAVISNVSSKNEITFKVNGSKKSFNFKNNSSLDATVLLVEGNNTVEILASNAGGKDNDFVNIIYKKNLPQTTNPPKVTITSPKADPYTSKVNTAMVTAVVTGVSSQNNIQFLVNGKRTTKFSYSTNSNILKANIALNQGGNTYEVIATNNGGTDKAGGQIVYKPEQQKQLPIVTILNPTKNPYTSTTGSVNLQARIQHISGRNDVKLTIGGKTNNSFSFKNGVLSIQFDIPLNGTTAVITATNADGNDTKSVRLNFNKPTVNKPVINVVNPKRSPYTATKAAFVVQATIQNVTNKNEVTVKNNGKTVSNFTFVNGKLKYAVIIPTSGTNIQITATNAGGSDSETVRLNYNQPKQPPVITMINPRKSPHTSTKSSIELKAKVQYVSGRNDISVTVNGIRKTGFTFTNEILTMLMDIPLNGATVVITATNADGQDVETIKINYNKVVVKPTVTITNPNRPTFTSKRPTMNVIATVQNVASKNNITVKVNGKSTNFGYSNGAVSIPVTLSNGKTTVAVTANNADGSDTKTVVLTYNKPKQPPVITMINPRKSPHTSTKSSIELKAKVQYVSGRNNISVTVNGIRKTGFTFTNEILTMLMDIPLNGATIVITATNADGQDVETVKVNYSKPVSKPTIVLRAPSKVISTTTKSTANVSVVVSDITAKNQIKITLNGRPVSNFNFTQSNGSVVANLQLKNGVNTIVVTAENAGGKARKQLSITRAVSNISKPKDTTKPVQTTKPTGKPAIKILQPNKNGATVTTQKYIVKASVLGVTGQNAITVKVNGKVVKGLKYNVATGRLQFTTTLKAGNNTIVITAKNAVGTSAQTRIVKLNTRATKNKSNRGN